jgi:hypothetical protein
VTDWGQVPYNEARYGTNACGSIVCSTVWRFVRDSVNDWYAKQIAAGKTPADINAYHRTILVKDSVGHRLDRVPGGVARSMGVGLAVRELEYRERRRFGHSPGRTVTRHEGVRGDES